MSKIVGKLFGGRGKKNNPTAAADDRLARYVPPEPPTRYNPAQAPGPVFTDDFVDFPRTGAFPGTDALPILDPGDTLSYKHTKQSWSPRNPLSFERTSVEVKISAPPPAAPPVFFQDIPVHGLGGFYPGDGDFYPGDGGFRARDGGFRARDTLPDGRYRGPIVEIGDYDDDDGRRSVRSRDSRVPKRLLGSSTPALPPPGGPKLLLPPTTSSSQATTSTSITPAPPKQPPSRTSSTRSKASEVSAPSTAAPEDTNLLVTNRNRPPRRPSSSSHPKLEPVSSAPSSIAAPADTATSPSFSHRELQSGPQASIKRKPPPNPFVKTLGREEKLGNALAGLEERKRAREAEAATAGMTSRTYRDDSDGSGSDGFFGSSRQARLNRRRRRQEDPESTSSSPAPSDRNLRFDRPSYFTPAPAEKPEGSKNATVKDASPSPIRKPPSPIPVPLPVPAPIPDANTATGSGAAGVPKVRDFAFDELQHRMDVWAPALEASRLSGSNADTGGVAKPSDLDFRRRGGRPPTGLFGSRYTDDPFGSRPLKSNKSKSSENIRYASVNSDDDDYRVTEELSRSPSPQRKNKDKGKQAQMQSDPHYISTDEDSPSTVERVNRDMLRRFGKRSPSPSLQNATTGTTNPPTKKKDMTSFPSEERFRNKRGTTSWRYSDEESENGGELTSGDELKDRYRRRSSPARPSKIPVPAAPVPMPTTKQTPGLPPPRPRFTEPPKPERTRRAEPPVPPLQPKEKPIHRASVRSISSSGNDTISGNDGKKNGGTRHRTRGRQPRGKKSTPVPVQPPPLDSTKTTSGSTEPGKIMRPRRPSRTNETYNNQVKLWNEMIDKEKPKRG